ncbi:MAG: DUF1028 domain-containing protein [Chloroflexota bacterium]
MEGREARPDDTDGGMTSSVGTFSIVAMDADSPEWGIAVASRVPDVGYAVAWVQAGVGAVASQAQLNPYLGAWALQELAAGAEAPQALDTVLAKDPTPELRQVGLVDRQGRTAAHTGKSTLEWAGHRTAPGVSVQGNILAGPRVLDHMLDAFGAARGPLGERLLAALEAGEQAGGDRRGRQSAALFVRRARGGYQGVDDRLIELKVTDHQDPIPELRRLYEIWQYAYLAPAYLRLSDEEKERGDFFLGRVHGLLCKALQHPLSEASAYNNLAWELALRKRFPDETLQAAEMAHRLSPEDAGVLDTLAEAHYAAGNPAQAVYWETEALQRAPDNAFLQQQLDKFTRALQETSASPAASD